MKKQHQTQHRQVKETKEPSKKEFYDLRIENRKLKREVSRLKRNLEKQGRTPEDENEFEDETTEILPAVASANLCPSCGLETLKELDLGIKIFIACPRCLWRKPIKSTGS